MPSRDLHQAWRGSARLARHMKRHWIGIAVNVPLPTGEAVALHRDPARHGQRTDQRDDPSRSR
jgi:hypothetical protein